MTNGIIWIASYPKSGNTWVRCLLANLFWQRPDGPLPLNLMGLKMPGDGRAEMFEKVAGKPITDMTTGEIHAAREGVQKLFTEMGRTQFVKTHSAYCKEAGHWHIAPRHTAGAIYIVRDPRDVALSVMNHFGLTAEQAVDMLNEKDMALGADATRYVWNRLSDWSTHVATWGRGLEKRCCLVRYEDLHTNPHAVLSAVCQWGSLTFSPDRIAKAVEYSAFDRMRSVEDAEGFTESSPKSKRFFHKGRVGRWKAGLPPALVAKIEAKHGPMMKMLGYQLIH